MNTYRKPHAPSDLSVRKQKALKIERLVNLKNQKSPQRVLEIGTGSGGISHYFASHPSIKLEVDSVDVTDVRSIEDGFNFKLVSDTRLPFEDQTFDLVISNHVIEHVGDYNSQLHHLKEIRRVMKPQGLGYLALPNRWMLIEPHYRLAFLSWLPKRLRTPYLNLRGKGDFYDCEPLALPELESLIGKANLTGKNICPEALLQTFLIESPHSIMTKLIKITPKFFIKKLNRVNPTLIYLLKRA
jgi:SAM-dependent methyltransferase